MIAGVSRKLCCLVVLKYFCYFRWVLCPTGVGYRWYGPPLKEEEIRVRDPVLGSDLLSDLEFMKKLSSIHNAETGLVILGKGLSKDFAF